VQPMLCKKEAWFQFLQQMFLKHFSNLGDVVSLLMWFFQRSDPDAVKIVPCSVNTLSVLQLTTHKYQNLS
jgi:hypothetical protein